MFPEGPVIKCLVLSFFFEFIVASFVSASLTPQIGQRKLFKRRQIYHIIYLIASFLRSGISLYFLSPQLNKKIRSRRSSHLVVRPLSIPRMRTCRNLYTGQRIYSSYGTFPCSVWNIVSSSASECAGICQNVVHALDFESMVVTHFQV